MSKIGCLIAAVVAILIVGGLGMSTYNGLVGSEQTVEGQWSQVQSAYQRRADLIPNLVATVKGAADFERTTLNEVVAARSRVGQVTAGATSDILNDPQKFQQFQQAQDQLSSALSRLLVVVEKYPDLKSIEGFNNLMSSIEGSENRINIARNDFNHATQDYNTRVKRFPAVLFAGLMGFQPKPYFQSQPGADTAPRVDFGTPTPAPVPTPR